ncbi:hypothetical protein [Sulfitobacter sp. SK012]|nr:hypothetical protein [Sulfitobacter sp. SK012]
MMDIEDRCRRSRSAPKLIIFSPLVSAFFIDLAYAGIIQYFV